jgi:two-component system chemotaxis response regulator CheY
MQFLIVDDSSIDRHLLTSLLKELGHNTEEYPQADGLLEKIENQQYDAIFLDIVMPNMDGYKFLRALRANPKTANQYVIFCSSKKTNIEINYGLKKAGANDYLVKPVTKDSLNNVLANIPK